MYAHSKEFVADIVDILRTIKPDVAQGTTVSPDTRLCAQLHLSHLDVVSLIGRLQGRFGTADCGPLFARLTAGVIDTLRVGDLVDHLKQSVTDKTEPDITPEPECGQAIVINNGRSGSTMLSDLLAEQGETVVAHEFFVLTGFMARFDAVISAKEYWAMIAAPGAYQESLASLGLRLEQVRYPRDGRWAGKVLPPILEVTLPAITPDPDAMFDALAERVPDFPEATVARHNERLLNLLCELTGRKRWIERSGNTSNWAPQLLALHPHAKIVYLTRDFDATVRSKSKDPFTQLDALRRECIAQYGIDPFVPGASDTLPDQARRFLPDQIDADTLRRKEEDSRAFQWHVAYLTAIAEQALADNPPAHLHRIRYEDIVRDPVTELTRLGRFLEFDDSADWAARVASQVRQR
jgi:putative sulfotransferase